MELSDGSVLPCFTRGKKSDVACGDRVDIQRTSDDQGVIEAIQPRTSLLYRSNEIRQKLIAANVDQVVIVVATEPGFSDELVTRALLAVESEEIEPLIVLNKCDLTDRLPAARQQLAVFAGLGYRVLELSARDHAEDLRPELQG
ncbi:MAG: GTPase RsgA, partial [Azonexus sp.]